MASGAEHVVSRLLDSGATPFCVTVEERPETVVNLAQKNGMNRCVSTLVEAGLKWCGVMEEVEAVKASGCYEPEELDTMLTELFC